MMRNIAAILEPTSEAPAPCRACDRLTDCRPPGGLCYDCLGEADAWLEWLDNTAECQSLCMDDPTDRARMAVLLVTAQPLGGDQ